MYVSIYLFILQCMYCHVAVVICVLVSIHLICNHVFVLSALFAC